MSIERTPELLTAVENALRGLVPGPSSANALLDQLDRVGLRLQFRVDTREPRRVRYSHAETNRLVKEALEKHWPQVPFFMRSSYGGTKVYYWELGEAPTRQQVEQVTKAFAGAVFGNCDSWEPVEQARTGADGWPELVSYGATYWHVYPVVMRGAVSARADGRTHIESIVDAGLRASLRKAFSGTGIGWGR